MMLLLRSAARRQSLAARCLSTGRNPFDSLMRELAVDGTVYKYFSVKDLPDSEKLPYSIRVLLECAVRNCDESTFMSSDVDRILHWQTTARQQLDVPFRPGRVLLQDLTGVPAIADLAAMRDALAERGCDPMRVNPLCQVDLVVDHSVQADFVGPSSRAKNEDVELRRNAERFQFLKWGQKAFNNLRIIPPGNGIVHQINIEYLASVVSLLPHNVLAPDSVIGTDSHTTMVSALGVLGWGVGGIEAEAVMLGEAITMTMPEVFGVRLTGKLGDDVTATDLVLHITAELRKRRVVGKYVEFFGDGVSSLSLPERATVSNMAPEYGATTGFFPTDEKTLEYLRLAGRDPNHVRVAEQYLRHQGLLVDSSSSSTIPEYPFGTLEVRLDQIRPTLAGPKRPYDTIPVQDAGRDFARALAAPAGHRGFGVKKSTRDVPLRVGSDEYRVSDGAVFLAAITSCTNTSNPYAMVGAGMVAQAAVKRGLSVPKFVKTILSPGSRVVTEYLKQLGLLAPLETLGFYVSGYGCMACIGNSGSLKKEAEEVLRRNEEMVGCAVLSGNRNFEGRIHALIKGNYLASPPLVVAYALAGRMDINFETEPIGVDKNGDKVFLRDIWPDFGVVAKKLSHTLVPDMFRRVYSTIEKGNESWDSIPVQSSPRYAWDPASTYIRRPPFFGGSGRDPSSNIESARCLLILGDSVTTDHISPAGSIDPASEAANYLKSMRVERADLNTYGARRGNHEVMARGAFAHKRLVNRMLDKAGHQTVYMPEGRVENVFQAAELYREKGVPLIVIAGSDYGQGSSRDWAAK